MAGGYQVMPRLTADEYAELESSIVADGVQVPITVAPDGTIIDGHHRDEIARKHSLHCPRVTAEGSPEKLRGLAFSLNLHRRHLTREQKRDLVAESIKADPQLSDREHGRRTGVSKNTAAAVRDGLESTGQVDQSNTRVSGDGRVRPSTQPPRVNVCRDCDGYGCETCFPEEPSVPASIEAFASDQVAQINAGLTTWPEAINATRDAIGQSPKPTAAQKDPRRKPITDTARELGLDIAAITNRVEKLGADDRLVGKKNEVAPKLRYHLEQLIKVCQDLNQQLTTGV